MSVTCPKCGAASKSRRNRRGVFWKRFACGTQVNEQSGHVWIDLPCAIDQLAAQSAELTALRERCERAERVIVIEATDHQMRADNARDKTDDAYFGEEYAKEVAYHDQRAALLRDALPADAQHA